MVTGLLFVLIPLLVVGGVSIYRSAGALESSAKSEALAVAKGMANMADIAVGKEMKIVIQTAQRASVIKGAAKYSEGIADAPEIQEMIEEMDGLIQRSGSDYENIVVAGLDGKVISSEHAQIDISDRDYFQKAKDGQMTVARLLNPKSETVMAFAPVYSNPGKTRCRCFHIEYGFYIRRSIPPSWARQVLVYYRQNRLCIAHRNRTYLENKDIAQTEE